MAEEDKIETVVLELPSSEIKNWDDFEKLVHHAAYNEMRVAPEEHPFIISESTCANPKTREKITQIMFETFNVPALSIIPTSVLAMQAAAIDTGLSLHFGETSTEFVPVVDRVPLRELTVDFPITGGFTSGYLDNYLAKFIPDARKPAWLRDAKLRSFVSLDPASQETSPCVVNVADCYEVDLADMAWKIPEVIFYPSLAGVDHIPLVLTILDLVSSCPDDVQKQMLENIVISGGNANFPGFAARLQQDLQFVLQGQDFTVKVKSPAESRYTAWVGGSIFGSLYSEVENKFLTMDNYNEYGPTAIHSFVV